MKLLRFLLLAALSLAGAGARANDGSVTWGDAPQLTKSHPSVEMRSEIVRLTVGATETKVDCQFVFVNHGPACVVRMGFPDYSEEEFREAQRFKSFRSWVDGQAVPVRSVDGPLEDGYRLRWRVKAVSFGAAGTKRAVRRVRDTYTVDTAVEMRTSVSMASYTLHTGGSWRGPIGRSEVIVSFPSWRGPFRAVPRRAWNSETEYNRVAKEMERPGTVAYRGPGQAQVRGKTLRWVRTRWRPTVEDNIQIFFLMH